MTTPPAPRPDPPGLDLARLRRYLDAAVPQVAPGPLTAEVIAGGKSNLTYTLDDAARRWVLRRPPLGHVLATAHDMAREHRVLTALRPTAVPVPRTVALCTDPDVIGAPFYLMEFAEGTVYRTGSQSAALTPAGRERIAHAVVDVLADLHGIDPGAVGLADFGRPDGFLERQLRRWKTQLDASRGRELPGADELHASLGAHVPHSPAPSLIHGDYRLDNVMIGDEGRVTAVLDWEMSTLGDPLADLGLLLVYWSGLGELPGGPLADPTGPGTGFPGAETLAARYAERRPADLARLDWYVAFGFFKLAVIAEGIHHRYASGQTVGAGFDRIGQAVLPLLDRGAAALARDRAGRR